MGDKTLNEHFYKPDYGAKGEVEKGKFDDALDGADLTIEANKNASHIHTNIVVCADYDHSDDAITAIASANKTLLVTEAETCDVNFTVPANVMVKFERGGKWTINNGITVTFNGQIDAGLWQIFSCTGTGKVTLNTGSTDEVYPEWWGAKGDGTTDDAAIFNTVLTQLNSSTVKIMRLNKAEYKITDTIILYKGISIIGRNNTYSSTSPQTKILFAPTSEKDLFDIYTEAVSYVYNVYLGGIGILGNTTGEVTFSRYAINSKAGNSIFENLDIRHFQDGIYCNFTMTNKYRNIIIRDCSHACIYTSGLQNSGDMFDNIIMLGSPWGVYFGAAYRFRFINALFQTLSVGAIYNITATWGGNDFITSYYENVPNTTDSTILSSTASIKTINLTGGKIDFPATQIPSADVNALDDYEEGSWTPALKFGGNSVGITYSIQAGLYTKIGRQVTVTCYVILTSKGTSTGNARLCGLPFTCKNDSGAYSAISMRLQKVTYQGSFSGIVVINDTEIALEEIAENGTLSFMSNTNFANDSDILISATYFTD